MPRYGPQTAEDIEIYRIEEPIAGAAIGLSPIFLLGASCISFLFNTLAVILVTLGIFTMLGGLIGGALAAKVWKRWKNSRLNYGKPPEALNPPLKKFYYTGAALGAAAGAALGVAGAIHVFKAPPTNLPPLSREIGNQGRGR